VVPTSLFSVPVCSPTGAHADRARVYDTIMFIRSKKRVTGTFYYLVENYRQGGQHRQRVLAYLGASPTLEDAIAATTRSSKLFQGIRAQLLKSALRSVDPGPELAEAKHWLELIKGLEAKREKLLKLQERAAREKF
jgi:hypothetical protein